MVDVRTPSSTDAVAPRRFVPTERQHAAGGVDGLDWAEPISGPVVVERAPDPQPQDPPILRYSPWRAVVNLFDSLTLRHLSVPRMPFYVLAISSMIGGWDDNVIALIGPELRSEFGFSLTTIQAIGSLTQLLGLVMAIPMGYLVDRVSRVMLLRIGAVVGQIAIFMQVFAVSSLSFVGSRLLQSGSAILTFPAIGPVVADYFKPSVRARVFLSHQAWRSLGGVIGLPLAGYLIVRFGWRSALFILTIPSLLALVGSFLLREPRRGEADLLEAGVPEEVASIDKPPVSIGTALRAGWSIRTTRRLAWAGVPTFLGLAPLATIMSFYFAGEFQLDPQQRSWIALFGTVVSMPALLLTGRVADRLLAFKPQRVLVIAGALQLVSALNFVIIAKIPILPLAIALTTFNGFVGTMVAPVQQTLMSLLIPAHVRGVGMQILTPFQLVGIVFSPAIIGLAARTDLQTALIMFTPLFALGGVITMTAAAYVERDLRATRAANLAASVVEEASSGGSSKSLICRDVDVSYGQVQVVFGVDLDVEAGETVALLGTNGAGKSSLMRAIAGVHGASNGAIFFEGEDITHKPAHEVAALGLVMMPGGHAVFPSLTVEENLRTAALVHYSAEADTREQLDVVLAMFPQLRERLQQQAGTLSGGEQQMVALSQAFLMRPKLLMIDELSLGLAPAVVEQLLETLRRIREQGTTILLVEQSINIALTVAERAVFMEKGEVLFDGPTHELLARPDLVRSVFMGGAAGGRTAPTRRSKATERESVLRVEDVAVRFGGVQALRGVSLDVEPGEVLGIIGPNGAGKTTLFDVISGYLRPDEGVVILDGADVSALGADARARLGLSRSFQSARLFPALTVRETITVAYEKRAVKSAAAGALWTPKARRSERLLERRVEGLIDMLGLEAYADKFVRELSTGTRRAVDFACIMAAEPKVLLLDEPSSGLAQAESEALGPALLRVVRDSNCGMIVIEHDMPLISSISDRLIALELGAVIATGATDAVMRDPRVLESYLSASADVLERSGSRVASAVAQLRAAATAAPPSPTFDHPEEHQ